MNDSTRQSGQAGSMQQASLCVLLPIFALTLIAPSIGGAQVPPPITTSITRTTGAGDLGTTVTPAGNLYNITGGTRPGNGPNLFHSFGDFTVGAGDIANFLNNSGLLTNNILSRVTGGNPSNIFGTIQTNGPGGFGNANFYLMNPYGIVFGPTASLNVGGSVSFTTAQYIRLFDSVNGVSANFYANPVNDSLANSVLAVDSSVMFEFLSPAAYGFLTAPNPDVTITVQGSTLSVPSSPLDSPPNTISLVGGKVIIEGAKLLDGTIKPAQLSAPNGRILLASTASPGEFDASTLLPSFDNPDAPLFTSFGSVSLEPGSRIDVSGGNTVWIKGGQLVISVNDARLNTSGSPTESNTISLSPGSRMLTVNFGEEPGADLQMTAGKIQMDGASIISLNAGSSRGGNITANVGELLLMNDARISSINSSDAGEGGNVTVQGLNGAGATSVTLVGDVDHPNTQITTSAGGAGPGGNILISSNKLQLDGATVQSSTTGDGKGGNITADVGTLTLKNFSSIESISDGGLGQGGNVTVEGLPGADNGAATSVNLFSGSGLNSKTTGGGEGGRLDITAGTLTMEGGATINSFTQFTGAGGEILLKVGNASLSGGANITSHTELSDPNAVAGPGGTITVEGLGESGSKADALTLTGLTTNINSFSIGTGRLGDIVVRANSITLGEQAAIQAGTQLDTGRTAGNVTIEANQVAISGGSRIASQVAAANAGEVNITANQLTMDNGVIETSTHGIGKAGDVVLKVGDISLSNGSAINSSSFSTDPGAGNAGNVTITASGAFMSNASTIATSAEIARGGDILINAHSVQLSNGALISANSNAPLLPDGGGDAGNITINSASNIIMQNSSITTEAAHASGGQVTLTAPDLIQLVDSNISTSVAGSDSDTAGGNISIDPQFVILQNSQILAQAFAGSGGAIDITAGVFLADPSSIVDASSTLGISGTVQINAPINNLSSVVGRLSESVLAAQALLRAACAARLAQGQVSSFVERGRDSIPTGPDGLLASPYLPPSSEPLAQTGGLRLGSDYVTSGESLERSAVRVRRLLGPDSASRVTILSGDSACSS